MTGMTGFGVFLRKEMREAMRTSRLPVVAGVFLILGMLSPLSAKYTPDLLKSLGGAVQVIMPTPQASDAVDQFLKNVGGDGIFIAILVAMTAVAREKERGTLVFVLAKPLARPALLAAKLAALLTTLGIGVGLAALAGYGYTVWLFGPLSALGWAACAALVWLMLAAYACVTFLGSVVARSPLPAAGLGMLGFVILAILGALPHVGQYIPSALMEPARALALDAPPPHLGASLAATVGVMAVTAALAWLVFHAQEPASTSA